jgi:hypothetical protein
LENSLISTASVWNLLINVFNKSSYVIIMIKQINIFYIQRFIKQKSFQTENMFRNFIDTSRPLFKDFLEKTATSYVRTTWIQKFANISFMELFFSKLAYQLSKDLESKLKVKELRIWNFKKTISSWSQSIGPAEDQIRGMDSRVHLSDNLLYIFYLK